MLGFQCETSALPVLGPPKISAPSSTVSCFQPPGSLETGALFYKEPVSPVGLGYPLPEIGANSLFPALVNIYTRLEEPSGRDPVEWGETQLGSYFPTSEWKQLIFLPLPAEVCQGWTKANKSRLSPDKVEMLLGLGFSLFWTSLKEQIRIKRPLGCP